VRIDEATRMVETPTNLTNNNHNNNNPPKTLFPLPRPRPLRRCSKAVVVDGYWHRKAVAAAKEAAAARREAAEAVTAVKAANEKIADIEKTLNDMKTLVEEKTGAGGTETEEEEATLDEEAFGELMALQKVPSPQEMAAQVWGQRDSRRRTVRQFEAAVQIQTWWQRVRPRTDPSKMKVPELRAALRTRKLPTSGKKAELQCRLHTWLAQDLNVKQAVVAAVSAARMSEQVQEKTIRQGLWKIRFFTWYWALKPLKDAHRIHKVRALTVAARQWQRHTAAARVQARLYGIHKVRTLTVAARQWQRHTAAARIQARFYGRITRRRLMWLQYEKCRWNARNRQHERLDHRQLRQQDGIGWSSYQAQYMRHLKQAGWYAAILPSRYPHLYALTPSQWQWFDQFPNRRKLPPAIIILPTRQRMNLPYEDEPYDGIDDY